MSKIKNKKELEILSNQIYVWLLKNNRELLNKYLPDIRIKWTLEKCKQCASLCKTKHEWEKRFANSYRAALRNKEWYKECTKHMASNREYNYTKDKFISIIMKYNTKAEFYKGDYGAYQSLSKKEYKEELLSYLRPSKNIPVSNIDTGIIFRSVTAAAESVNAYSTHICRSIKNGTKCGGYHWAYCDEEGNIIK